MSFLKHVPTLQAELVAINEEMKGDALTGDQILALLEKGQKVGQAIVVLHQLEQNEEAAKKANARIVQPGKMFKA